MLKIHSRSVVIFLFCYMLTNAIQAERPIRVLSIDGGGIRGLIPAVVLDTIEKKTNKPISQVFDLIAGSSTGGMIALALTAPNAQGKPVQTAHQVVNFYLEHGDMVFHTSFMHWLKTLGGLIGPRYESAGLAQIFNNYLGDTMLSEALTPTLITGYHLDGQVGVEFYSEDALKYPEDRDCLMREVALATSAAPVYFDVADVQFKWGKLEAIADGCLYKLNPAMLGYVHAKKMYPNRTIEVYSLGTGQSSAEDLTMATKGRGIMHWLSPAVRHVLHGHTESDDSALHQMLNNEAQQNYFRLNVRIDREHNELDDISKENISYLYSRAQALTKSTIFQDVMERLSVDE